MQNREWSRGDVIAFVALLVTAAGVAASIFVPEIRVRLGRDATQVAALPTGGISEQAIAPASSLPLSVAPSLDAPGASTHRLGYSAPPTDTLIIPDYRTGTFLDRFDDVDTRTIRLSDLQGLSLTELGLLRNYVYARHGRPFVKERYRSYFSKFSWYRPSPSYSDSALNTIEMTNVETIQRYELTQR